MEKKEAMKILKDFHDKSALFSVRTALDTIIPELAESEDEKIRKELITWLQNTKGQVFPIDRYNAALAWLEKQGKQKPFDYEHANIQQKDFAPKVEPKFRVKYAGSEYNVLEIKEIAGDAYYGIEDEPNHIDYVLPDNCEIVSEQKSAWSEEDEKIFGRICALIHSAAYKNYDVDEDGNECGEYANIKEWFKKLKDRVQLQNITVTDEELVQAKKDAYNDALDKIEYHSGEPTFDDGWSAAIWYLKKRNAMPQTQWKPSDEQME